MRGSAMPSLSAALLGLACLCACSEDSPAEATSSAGQGGSSSSSGGAGQGGSGLSEPIAWEPCPLYEGSDVQAECATVPVPLSWDDPAGPMIDHFVQRLMPAGPSRGQLWLLAGGPGSAGNVWASFMEQLASLDMGLELYAPDHRGTGRSTRLGCPAQESSGSDQGAAISDAEWPACIDTVVAEWGDGLAGFSSASAARDLASLIERSQPSPAPAFLYGVSYGTIWGHRFLQLYPDRASGVILDSINWPDRTLEDYDLLFEDVAARVFEACADDALCASKLGADPWVSVGAMYEALAAGHCPELAAAGVDDRALARALAWSMFLVRAAAPALVYRVLRCDAADVTAVLHAHQVISGPAGLASDPLFSAVLGNHIGLSEVGRVPPSGDAQRFATSCRACLGAGVVAPYAAGWPRYPFGGLLLEWATTATPLLMVDGGLDPFMPAHRLQEAGIERAFTAPNQRFVPFATSGHAVVQTSGCAFDLFLQFLTDPAAPLDDGCASVIEPVDFTVDAQAIFGTGDAWEN